MNGVNRVNPWERPQLTHDSIKSFKFTGSWNDRCTYFVVNGFPWIISTYDLQAILNEDKFAAVTEAFIEKLENPAEFVKGESGLCMRLPKALTLKAQMSKLVGE